MLEAVNVDDATPIEVRPAPLGEFVAAYIKAKAKMETLVKKHKATITGDRANFSYKFANLADILEVCEGPLGEEGIGILQDAEIMIDEKGNQYAYAYTTLYHAPSNQYRVSGFIKVYGPSAKPAARELGSMLTYARKYSALAAVNLASEDDDGAAAGAPDQRQTPARQSAPAAQPTKPVTPKATPAPVVPAPPDAADDVVQAGGVDANAAARTALKTLMVNVFGREEITGAAEWMIKRYTTNRTPANVRSTTDALTLEEMKDLTTTLKANKAHIAGLWNNEKQLAQAPLPVAA